MKYVYYFIILGVLLFGTGVSVEALSLFGAEGILTTEIPYGGRRLYTFDESVCTCGGNSRTIFDYRTKSNINLYKSPKSIFYLYFNTEATNFLGTYSVPPSADCRVYTIYGCYTLQTNIGDFGMLPGTGTSQF